MSPVAPSSGHAGRALITGTVAVVVIMGGLFLAAKVYSNQDSPKVRLGDQTFHGGSTARLSKAIAKGGPIIYTDVSGTGGPDARDIILQHIGPKEATGWYAIAAQPPGKERSCTWQWQKASRTFRAKCDRSLTAPADGAGLERYPVTVANGQIDVDLNADARPTTTTSTASTTTTAPQSGDTKPPG